MFTRYFRSCKARGLAEQTLRTYKEGLNFLERFLTEQNIELKDITSEDVNELVLWLDDGKRSARTIQSHMLSIRTFLYYEMEQGRIKKKFRIKINKGEEAVKEIYSDSEIEKLLKKPNIKKCSFSEYKVWVFENYLMGTGNRLNSVINIQIKDVNLDEGYLILRQTKNKKQQYVPLCSSLVDILDEYMEIRKGNEYDYLFCSSNGDKADRRTYQELVARYNRCRGVEKTSIHLFRHTFATVYIRNGGDIYRLSKLLGHSDVGITEHYIHTLPIDIMPNYDDNNPLEFYRNNSNSKKRIRMN